MKLVVTLGLELLILLTALAFIFHNFIMGFDEGGDAVFLVWFYFSVIFLVASILYVALRFLLSHKQKTFLLYSALGTLIGLPILFSLFLINISRESAAPASVLISLSSLPIIPLTLLALRYLFLKLLATKKR